MVATTVACHVDEGPLPTDDATAMYQSLSLNHHGVMIGASAPDDTVRLSVVPRSATGAVLTAASAPRFVSSDPTILQVSANGLVTAMGNAGTADVIASLQINGVTREDTARIRVAPSSPVPALAEFSIQPAAGDSAKVAVSVTRMIPVIANAVGGDAVPVVVYFTQSNPAVAVVDPYTGFISGRAPGKTTVYAKTTVAGVTWTDSLEYVIGAQIDGIIRPTRFRDADGQFHYEFVPSEIVIGAGGGIRWTRIGFAEGSEQYDIVFDDPSVAFHDPSHPNDDGVDGDIATWIWSSSNPATEFRFRRFFAADTVSFHSVKLNASGKLIVIDDRP